MKYECITYEGRFPRGNLLKAWFLESKEDIA